MSTGCEIEHCADSLRECIVRSYENNCSLSSKSEGYGKIWWSPELSALRKKVRRLYNKSYRSKFETDRKAFRDAQKEYKKELERAGSRSWHKCCSEVDSLSDTARLCRVLRNGTPKQVGPLKTVTGEWAEDAPAVLEGLIAAHFPDVRVEAPRSSPVPKARGCDWATAVKIATLETLRWALSTFEPCKAPGSDGIYLVLL